MKRILGLDLGSSSIGWAIVEEYSKEIISESESSPQDKIIALGSRIIPLSPDENTQFSKGQALTKNAVRTRKRTQRKGYDRYQLRRALLLEKLTQLGMYNGTTLKLSTLDLWGARAKAVNEQVSLLELGRILCHINQKRGYRTVKSDYGDKEKGEYVKNVVERYKELDEQGITIGQFMYNGLKEDPAFRCKERIYPRDAYVEEYDAIMEKQKSFYPDLLSDETIAHIRNYIIFHQRPLKSCKHLVGKCELERHDRNINGNTRNCGPKTAPRSSPLFQVCKIWETINNLNIQDKQNDTLYITIEQKNKIFDFMNTHEKLKVTDLKKLLEVKTNKWLIGKSVGTGLQGNTTYCAIAKALGDFKNKEQLLEFNLTFKEGKVVDTDTGELSKVIDESFEHQPLYKLWHVLYSISNIQELEKVLKDNFGIEDPEIIANLCKLDFIKSGYCNKSSRAMRKILQYLMDGIQYYDAKLAAGYNDTTLTKEQNEARQLAEKLLPISKGELRQPVVEKILNQLVNLVNTLMAEHGRFDEIRIELARELKQSREERESATNAIKNNNTINENAAKRIKEYGLSCTKSRIQKYRLWEEAEHKCIYCGSPINIDQFLSGIDAEVEHIIPRSVLFDDSFSNKVCSCRACNKEKNNRTAYDYMKSKGEAAFNAYLERVNELAEKYNPKATTSGSGISKTKRNNLLMPGDKLPIDFINRQLRESQYIAKKAKEMLQSICYNVYSTSGGITDFIRHIWGWDDVLHSINFERYRSAGLTETIYREKNGHKMPVERIKDWSKRSDHRHHAIDALTIACTKQGYIQRINNLNSLKEVSFANYNSDKQGEGTHERLSKLEKYLVMQPHFSVAEVKTAVEGIAVSFKSGKRAANVGKRYIYKGGKRICLQKDIIIPRGALSEESVYGCITDSKSHNKEYVIKYKIESILPKHVNSIVDKGIQTIIRQRLEQYGNDPKKAFAEPVLDHQGREIRSVRRRVLNSAVPLRYNTEGKAIAFVMTGNNHHVAIYVDSKGKLHEHVVTFWHAVERKKNNIPIVIKDPASVLNNLSYNLSESFKKQLPESPEWQFKLSMQQNEMFILGMDEEAYQIAMKENDYALLSRYLYRVQKIAKGDYVFRHHLETTVDDNSTTAQQLGKMKRLALKSLFANNPHKVHVSITGKITEI